MSETDRWLDELAATYRQIGRAPVYWLSVPVAILGFVGVLWSVPVPDAFREISPVLNWGTTFLLAAVVYYFIISLPLAFGMLPFVLAIVAFHIWLQFSQFSAIYASTGLAIAGLFGLAMGRRGHGGIQAMAFDIQHVMIAPMWLLSRLYQKIGIPH